MKMENCSFHNAASKLEKEYTGINLDSFSFHGNTVSNEIKNDESTTTIQSIIPITHPKLIAWVQERRLLCLWQTCIVKKYTIE
ncbi:MAG: hypothetical protein LBR10_05430 [Prevotellaceae bacterium]|jgi:hypothetical protein|nr:hypothetical protein [Prevotellaceae bacterium]